MGVCVVRWGSGAGIAEDVRGHDCIAAVLVFLRLDVILVATDVVLTQITSETAQADFHRWRLVSRDGAIFILSAGIAMVIPFAAQIEFASRLGTVLAGFSYSLYLIHLPMEQILLNVGLLRRHDVLDAGTMSRYAGLGMLQLAARIFYYCFERQTGLVRRWLRNLGKAEACPTPEAGRIL